MKVLMWLIMIGALVALGRLGHALGDAGLISVLVGALALITIGFVFLGNLWNDFLVVILSGTIEDCVTKTIPDS
jgi:hypothetical protein